MRALSMQFIVVVLSTPIVWRASRAYATSLDWDAIPMPMDAEMEITLDMVDRQQQQQHQQQQISHDSRPQQPDNMFIDDSSQHSYYRGNTATHNATDLMERALRRAERLRSLREKHSDTRNRRMAERRQRARDKWSQIPSPPRDQLQALTPEEIENLPEDRKLSWFGSDNSYSSLAEHLANPGAYYDKWAQAYRMLGGFIDCDHAKSSNNKGGKNNNNNYNYNSNQYACSRWMMWAAYVNPNYQGNEYDEYYSDDPVSVLDCHNPDTEWQLLGVYRQEFYQYLEQISKHLWAINEYEYVVALAGLSYMTKYDCFQIAKDGNGNPIYAGIAPQPYGKFQMALYTDTYCLEPDESGKTVDDYGLSTDIYLGSKDQTDDDSYNWASQWWSDTQEYTLTQMNDVYEEYKYCTSCVDYPTYQDGYFIGDDGTDDDDLINQCWKFHSHNSYTCEADCIAMGHAQGTILSIKYGDATFGKTSNSFYESEQGTPAAATSPLESPFSRLLANIFLAAAFVVFIATFLAFAVARRSRYRESRSSRSHRLLDESTAGGGTASDARSRKSRRSSRSKMGDGDGLFRTSGTSRSKSKDHHRSKSRTKSRSTSSRGGRTGSSRSKSRSKSASGGLVGSSYDPPKVHTPRTRTSHQNDDFL